MKFCSKILNLNRKKDLTIKCISSKIGWFFCHSQKKGFQLVKKAFRKKKFFLTLQDKISSEKNLTFL